jgi:type IV secretory pathway VirB2 component (pilin)
LAQNQDVDPNCQRFLNWFTIEYNNKATSSAVEGLPVICNAQTLVTKVIDLFFLFAGSVAVIFIMIGGFRYVTSGGNEEQSEAGRKTLTTSVIGLVIIILAATIVRIVVSTLGTGSTKTNQTPNPATQQSGNTGSPQAPAQGGQQPVTPPPDGTR